MVASSSANYGSIFIRYIGNSLYCVGSSIVSVVKTGIYASKNLPLPFAIGLYVGHLQYIKKPIEKTSLKNAVYAFQIGGCYFIGSFFLWRLIQKVMFIISFIFPFPIVFYGTIVALGLIWISYQNIINQPDKSPLPLTDGYFQEFLKKFQSIQKIFKSMQENNSIEQAKKLQNELLELIKSLKNSLTSDAFLCAYLDNLQHHITQTYNPNLAIEEQITNFDAILKQLTEDFYQLLVNHLIRSFNRWAENEANNRISAIKPLSERPTHIEINNREYEILTIRIDILFEVIKQIPITNLVFQLKDQLDALISFCNLCIPEGKIPAGCESLKKVIKRCSGENAQKFFKDSKEYYELIKKEMKEIPTKN